MKLYDNGRFVAMWEYTVKGPCFLLSSYLAPTPPTPRPFTPADTATLASLSRTLSLSSFCDSTSVCFFTS